VLIKANLKYAARMKSSLMRINKYLNYVTNFNNIMIVPKFVSKASGVRIALDYLGINPERTIVIGDAENDLDLFTIPAFKIAVANAHPRLKMVADYVTQNSFSKGVIEIADRLTNEGS
jgi:HAD superfamily hydrolase (TIGR01484 family)